MRKPKICIDFDGVLNLYTGWTGENDLSEYRPGARDFLANASIRYEVVVFTTRDATKVADWLDEHECVYDEVTNIKPPAKCYVDDRAVRFDGDFVKTLEDIDNFKAYWEG